MDAFLDTTLSGRKLYLAIGFGLAAAASAGAWAWTVSAEKEATTKPKEPKVDSQKFGDALTALAKEVAAENGLIKRAILAETDPAERQKLSKCGTYALRKFSDKAEAKMLAGLGLTKAEGEAALAYFVHPAVADPLVTRASIAVKMSAAPTVYSPDKALSILASVSSPESMSAVQAKLVKQGANLMAQLRNPQAVASQLVRLAQAEWNQRLYDEYGCNIEQAMNHVKFSLGCDAMAKLTPHLHSLDKALQGMINTVMQQVMMGGMGGMGGMRMM